MQLSANGWLKFSFFVCEGLRADVSTNISYELLTGSSQEENGDIVVVRSADDFCPAPV